MPKSKMIKLLKLFSTVNCSSQLIKYEKQCRFAASSQAESFFLSESRTKSREAELMQKRLPVGRGPSPNTCPRCALHLEQLTSVRTIPGLAMRSSRLAPTVRLSGTGRDLTQLCEHHSPQVRKSRKQREQNILRQNQEFLYGCTLNYYCMQIHQKLVKSGIRGWNVIFSWSPTHKA